jgi:hypothetical protein
MGIDGISGVLDSISVPEAVVLDTGLDADDGSGGRQAPPTEHHHRHEWKGGVDAHPARLESGAPPPRCRARGRQGH